MFSPFIEQKQRRRYTFRIQTLKHAAGPVVGDTVYISNASNTREEHSELLLLWQQHLQNTNASS